MAKENADPFVSDNILAAVNADLSAIDIDAITLLKQVATFSDEDRLESCRKCKRSAQHVMRHVAPLIDAECYCSTTEDEFSEVDPLSSLFGQKAADNDKGSVIEYSFFHESRFFGVPPTVRFCLPGERVARPKKSVRRTLSWCHNSLLPKVVRKTLANSHFTIVQENRFWIGYWGKHLRTTNFHTILPHQKVNHYPGTFHMGRKDRLWTNIERMMIRFGKETFNIMPKTYLLPRDLKRLKSAMLESGQKLQFILKPPASARGTGIQIVHKWSQVPKQDALVAQLYIARPFLVCGSKFDLRLYVYVTSFNPLRVYLYEDGLVRFASVKYSNSVRTLGNKFMHLTNYSINKTATGNEPDPSVTGCKWRLRTLWELLAEQGHDVRKLLEQIVDLILKSILSCEKSVHQYINDNLNFAFTCHELFGFDIMLDEHLKPWLLEINISPSLQSSSDLDVAVKQPIARDVLNLAGISVPDRAQMTESGTRLPLNRVASTKPYCLDFRVKPCEPSEDELAKQKHYIEQFQATGETDASILDCLTPNDLRVLIDTEDEFARRGGFTRIMPSLYSSAYLGYFEKMRYYNLLLDEWLTQYYHIQDTGVQYLQSLCKDGLHLVKTPASEEHQKGYYSCVTSMSPAWRYQMYGGLTALALLGGLAMYMRYYVSSPDVQAKLNQMKAMEQQERERRIH